MPVAPAGGAPKTILSSWAALTLVFIAALVGCGCLIAAKECIDVKCLPGLWLLTEAILLIWCGIAGYIAKSRIDGILIDEQNRISLSRFQWIAWLVVLLGGYFAEAVWNVARGTNTAEMLPAMQPELWALLGIVAGGAVVSAITLDAKRKLGQVVRNEDAAEASWANLYLGEETANADVVDVSRMQKLVVTILLVMAYAQMLWGAFVTAHANTSFTQMPLVGQTFIWLAGISQAAHLAYQATTKTPTR